MQFDANLAPARANPVPRQAGSIAGEIDLYDELLAFVEMTPEKQRLYLTETKSADELTDTESVDAAPQAAQLTLTDPVEPETVDAVAPESASMPLEAVIAGPDSTPLDDEFEIPQPIAELSDDGDPLVDLNLDDGLTGVLSGKDCQACGAESSADDLFCMSCGSFLNGLASTPPSNPTCIDCGQGIAIDEIFCPWCGAVLAGN